MVIFTENEINSKLNEIDNYYNVLVTEFNKYPKEMWKYKPGESKWSIYEIIIHIIEVQIYIFTLLRSFLAEPERFVSSWNEEVWTKELNYHDEDITDWLEFFKLSNKVMLKKLKSLSYDKWTDKFLYDNKEITLCSWLKYNCSHFEEHLKHMNAVYNLWLCKNC